MTRDIKARIITTAIALVAIGAIGTLAYLNTKKDRQNPDEQTAADAETTSEMNLAEFKPADGELLSVRLPNSEELVYVEGADETTIANLDTVFRHYEESANTAEATDEAVEEGSLAWLEQRLTETEAKLIECFNPEFDLYNAYSEKTASINESHQLYWLVSGLSEQPEEAFYFREEEALGGYRMSAAYYFMGMVYVDLPTEADSLEASVAEK